QEEVLRFQQSREEWIASGDRNTKFYHAAATVRKARQKNYTIRDDFDNEINSNAAKAQVLAHFTKIFSCDNESRYCNLPRNHFPKISNEMWELINRPFGEEDIKKAMFDMAPFKAPGPDGFHAGFFQRMWSIVGKAVVEQTVNFFNSGIMQEGLNDTLVTLIPKVNHPDKVTQFRPISLCNVCYKVITKAMTNRIKPMIGSVIGPEQSSFVPNRQISNNIVIYQEVLHSMKKKTGSKGIMVLKIDLEKAYDRLSWDFIKETLEDVGFNNIWVRNIMSCVKSSRLALIWNNEQLDWITPSRGIRQGDAISPYLFVLCIERLSHLIRNTVRTGKWKGVKLARHGPVLSHLFFADDMVLFTEASQEQIGVIKECLECYKKF
ncbi:MAG: reverse transcriptase family protein, partial [Candidatus Phytoplasma australasiaticum]|nr:reverse transcriptase family protein [Candidatus Phytoplasma australasiaticum]